MRGHYDVLDSNSERDKVLVPGSNPKKDKRLVLILNSRCDKFVVLGSNPEFDRTIVKGSNTKFDRKIVKGSIPKWKHMYSIDWFKVLGWIPLLVGFCVNKLLNGLCLFMTGCFSPRRQFYKKSAKNFVWQSV